MRLTTALLLLLFSHHQPYRDARKITGDVLLELLETKLDEGLSYLEEGNARRAREEIQIVKHFGSMEAFIKEAMSERKEPVPTIP